MGKGCLAIPQEVGGRTYKRGSALFVAKAHVGPSRIEGCPESSFSERSILLPKGFGKATLVFNGGTPIADNGECNTFGDEKSHFLLMGHRRLG